MTRDEWLLVVAMWCACGYVGGFAALLSHAWSQSTVVVRWRAVTGTGRRVRVTDRIVARSVSGPRDRTAKEVRS